MSETAHTAVMMLASIVVPWALQVLDRRRLPPAARRRGWNVASWGAALYAFGPISMLGWVFVTRPWPRRLLVSVPAFWLAAGILIGLDLVLASAPTPPEEAVTGADVIITIGAGSVVVLALMLTVEAITRLSRRVRGRRGAIVAGVAGLISVALSPRVAQAQAPRPLSATAWTDHAFGAIRGITVGPIENALHPAAGYGTARGRAALREAAAMGATWVAVTPFGRVWDLHGEGLDLRFEAPLARNTRDVAQAIDDAHALGLRVLLVPHLWVETGGWRALIQPDDDAGWARWSGRYRTFLMHWADVAERHDVEMISAGVELRRWVTTRHAHSFVALVRELRGRFSGLITYSANWDDLAYTTVLGELDVIGVNAFFPLTTVPGATIHDLILGGERVARELQAMARQWDKPILLTEMGYTTRRDPALKPWLWPDGMTDVVVDERAQAMAYGALLAPLTRIPECAGFFVWRTYADPGDVSQEAEWGFSPRGKLAELILRDAFTATWAADGPLAAWAPFAGLSPHGFHSRRWGGHRARRPGVHQWSFLVNEKAAATGERGRGFPRP
ncbi:MAG: hypothetical protein AAF928_13850 [Myxococcota bacterium]